MSLLSTGAPKHGDAGSFGAVLNFAGLKPGHYQVSLSGPGWIDVVQNGKPLEATGHTGAKDCDGLRKSVRFEIGAGPVALQVSGAPKDTIKITARPAAD